MLNFFRVILLVLFSIHFSLSAQNNDWMLTQTGDNMTILIDLNSIPTIAGVNISTSDTIGIFYQDGSNFQCAGKIAWNGNVNQAISFPAYTDDSSTPATDGFTNNDSLIWRVKSSGTTYEATVVYAATIPFTNVFQTDGFAKITTLNIISTGAIAGCTDTNYLEYNPLATIDDGSCATLKVFGCTNSTFLDFNPNANVDDGSCDTLKVFGCTDTLYLEYNQNANVDDGSCNTLKVFGCTDTSYLEYNPNANVDNGSCNTLKIFGCMDPLYLEYNPNANVDDGSCNTLKVFGCTDTNYFEYDANANVDDGSCDSLKVYGCTDPQAQNYNPQANLDNGSCNYDCPNGTIKVILKLFPAKGYDNSWLFSENGQLLQQEGPLQLNNKDSVIHSYCFESNKNIFFSHNHLDSFAIIVCGALITPATSSTAVFTTNCDTDIPEVNAEQMVVISANNQLLISSHKTPFTQYELISITGKTLSSQPVSGNTFSINTSTTTSGIYILKLKNKKGSVYKKIFIK